MRLFIFYILLIQTIGNSYFSQTNEPISQGGVVNTCYATFTDSDANSGNYSPNENYTLTLCSDGTSNTNAVNLFFTSFDIDASDVLNVYDGNSIGATLLGSYNNSNPVPNNIITSTLNNTSGCLTFEFISDGSSEGAGWTALDSCILLCQPVDPIITTTPSATVYATDSVYTTICLGDVITFSANGTFPYQNTNPYSYTQTNANTTYEWFFGDGSSATGQTVTHTYQAQNGYLVWLKVTDVNGCIDYYNWKVRVGLTPSFTQVLPQYDTVCFNGTNTILGGYDPNSGTSSGFNQNTGSTVIGGIVADTTWLPDGSGTSYTSSIEIVGYPGQTINAASDIIDICMNIEHSYIGDLNMFLTCPDGTTITLMDEYNNGSGPGNTFLGDALDNTTPNAYGIGFNYCFDMNAVWGTMIAENAAGNYVSSTVTPGNNILAAGSYQPEETYANLVGCPIDGTWTVTITDNIGADDGYIYSWGVNLDPNLSTYAENFTVSVDTAYWDPDPTITSQTNNNLSVQSTNPGTYSYTFNVVDEYGCAYDTTVSFVTLPDFGSEAGPDSTLCIGNTYQFQGSNSGGQAPLPPCTFTLNMQDSWGDGWNGGSLDIFINGSLFSNQTVATSTNSFTFTLNDGDLLVLSYNSGSFDSEVTYDLVDCNGSNVFSDGPNPTVGTAFTYNYGNQYSFSYTWSPATGLNNTTILDPTLTASVNGYYYLNIQLNGFPQCGTAIDSLLITIDTSTLTPVMNGDTLVCEGTTVSYEAHDALYYLWEDGQTDTTTSFIAISDTTVQVIATTSCRIDTLTTFLDVVPYPNNLPQIPSPDTLCLGDNLVLDAGGQIESPYNLNYTWSPGADLSSTTVSNPTFSAGYTTTFTLTVETNGYPNCFTYTDSVEIYVDTNHVLPMITGDTLICFGDQTTFIASQADTYMWPDSSIGSVYSIQPLNDTIVVLQSSTECYNDVTNIPIIVTPLPNTSSSTDTTTAIDVPVTLFSSGGENYVWSPPTGLDCNTCDSVVATPSETTTYLIEITDSLGCVNYDTVTVSIEYFPYFLPNGFSPNNDGENDILYVRGTGIQSVFLQIFDRFGNLIFETSEQETGWDGTYKNKPVNTGVYIYSLSVQYKDGRLDSKQGNITLFR